MLCDIFSINPAFSSIMAKCYLDKKPLKMTMRITHCICMPDNLIDYLVVVK